jgi:glutamyl-tRNA synthetase
VDPAQLEPALRALAEQAGVRFKDLMMTLRVAITGRTVSPPLLESMAILGLGECVARIESALTELTAQPDPTP